MHTNMSRGSWLAFITLITLLWSAGTATVTSAGDFPWPLFNAALTTPRLVGAGSITLRFTNNALPHFDESEKAECELKSNSLLVCGLATLRYDVTEDNGQLKIRRNGSITFMPVGTCTQTTCTVDHQASIEETTTLWVWDGTRWQQKGENTVSDDWDDTLLFDLEKATQPGGSTFGVTKPTGTAYWTLRLPVIM